MIVVMVNYLYKLKLLLIEKGEYCEMLKANYLHMFTMGTAIACCKKYDDYLHAYYELLIGHDVC